VYVPEYKINLKSLQDIFEFIFKFTLASKYNIRIYKFIYNIENQKTTKPMNPIEYIQKQDKHILEKVVQWRRHLHQHPELSFEEKETTKYIASVLDGMGIPYEQVSPTGLIGIIHGNGSSEKSIALRADIDALPITEENQHGYASLNKGVMHACGHDFHSSNLLGVAYLLNEIKHTLNGNVVLIFQAAEERIPGGASAIVESGILDRYQVQKVIGQHVSPQLPLGTFGFKSGYAMASSDEIYIDIMGRGGHGAQPQLNIDPVIISAQLLVGLQQVVSRYADPRIPSVLSFGKVIADGAANVIPTTVHLAGTFRTTDEQWRASALAKIENLIVQTVDAYGASAKIEIKRGYPTLYNNPCLTAEMQQLATNLYGAENSLSVPTWMASEDFAYYAQKYPALFYFVGTRNEEKGIVSELHTPTFDIDETIYERSVEFMFKGAVSVLQGL